MTTEGEGRVGTRRGLPCAEIACPGSGGRCRSPGGAEEISQGCEPIGVNLSDQELASLICKEKARVACWRGFFRGVSWNARRIPSRFRAQSSKLSVPPMTRRKVAAHMSYTRHSDSGRWAS